MTDQVQHQQQLKEIQEKVQLAEAGYRAFRQLYASTNRRPEKKPYVSRNAWARRAIGVIMAASSIVSASHTIPVFAGAMGNDILANLIHAGVGIAAFFMGEMALAVFAYTGVMRHFRDTGKEPDGLKVLLKWGVGVPVIIMIVANILNQFETNGVTVAPVIKSLIVLAIALAAPLMAYISGEVFATFEVGDRIDEAKHEDEYTRRENEWEDRCLAAWERRKGNYGGNIRIETPPVQALPGVSNGIPMGNSAGNMAVLPSKSSIGHSKQPMARQMVVEFFQANPDALNGSALEIAHQLGVGKSTVYNVIKELKGQ